MAKSEKPAADQGQVCMMASMILSGSLTDHMGNPMSDKTTKHHLSLLAPRAVALARAVIAAANEPEPEAAPEPETEQATA